MNAKDALFAKSITKAKPLFAHQKHSVSVLRESESILDSSDPGTGKTRVQIEDFAFRRRKGGGKALVLASAEIGGIQKRYEFAEATGGCFHPKLQHDAKTYGNDAFSFAVLETIERKDTQTDREFAEDLDVLLALWLEKYDPANVY